MKEDVGRDVAERRKGADLGAFYVIFAGSFDTCFFGIYAGYSLAKQVYVVDLSVDRSFPQFVVSRVCSFRFGSCAVGAEKMRDLEGVGARRDSGIGCSDRAEIEKSAAGHRYRLLIH